LKSILRSGLGKGLFFDWRFLPDGTAHPDFVLNRPAFRGATILLTRENFGSGSSREHAPWALKDYGILCIIAPSYADIFYNNCFKNGMLPVVLAAHEIDRLFEKVNTSPGMQLTVDLPSQTVTDAAEFSSRFDIDPFRKKSLLEGLDDIAQTLQHEADIARYEAAHAR
jgi:3-isopropylmalate/(R)-2-methylmalate dehydratase small subunit